MIFSNLLWILVSYLLGSIPFGYIITRIWTGKNILKIGWKKTSGSNVFKNIGKCPGILTGLFDLGKGFLAVKGAQLLGFSLTIQALSGVAAVVGHNWSCFLKLAGGRGIGTFAGAALALAPETFALSLVFPLLIVVIWNASPATILLLLIFIFLSFRSSQEKGAGLFVVLSLFPIFLKRLSPISEILKPAPSQGKGVIPRSHLIRNRLIFDDDRPYLELRVKRIIKRLTSKNIEKQD